MSKGQLDSSKNEDFEALKREKKSRAAVKANLTRIENQIKLAIVEPPTSDSIAKVKEQEARYTNYLGDLKVANSNYRARLTDEDDKEECDVYLSAVERSVRELVRDIREWEGVLGEELPEVNPKDSVSQIGTQATTSTAARAKAAAKRASLAAKAALLHKRQELQALELKLAQQREELDLQMELAMAQAEEDAYAEPEEANAKPDTAQNEGSVTSLTPPDKKSQPDSTDRTQNPPANPASAQFQLLEALHLPRAELRTFDGNPIEYWSFIRAFQISVHNSSLSDSAKLTRLIQYCTGKAGELINCCAVMDPALGYVKALKMLEERFGDTHLIAEEWIKTITSGGPINQNDRLGLRDYADQLKSCQVTLDSMGYTSEMNNQRVLIAIAERLPGYLRNRWLREARKVRKTSGKPPTIVHLIEFVVDAAEEANDPVYGNLNSKGRDGKTFGVSQGGRSDKQVKGRGSNFNVTTRVTGESSGKCMKCDGPEHSLFSCDEFKAMRPAERLAFARRMKLCFNCLKTGHRSDKCRLNRTCMVPGCGRKHTKFLHVESNLIEGSSETPVINSNSVTPGDGNAFLSSEVTCANTGAGNKKIALPIVSVKVYATGSDSFVSTYALLDSGSTSCFCSEELVNQLGVHGKEEQLSLTTLGGEDCLNKTKVVELEVIGSGMSERVKLPRVCTRSTIPIREENIAKPEDINSWSYLRDLKLPQVDKLQVGLLIGQNVPEALLPLEVRKGKKGEPFATRTILGWSLSGPIGHVRRPKENYATSHYIGTDDNLDAQLKMFWRIDGNDNLSYSKGMSINDKKAVSIWEDTICHREGHYELAIPFKERPPNLPNNRDVAERRLQSLGKRLQRDPELLEEYRQGMKAVLDKGYAHVVPSEELQGEGGYVWYLPHHPVLHPMKPNKVRIVYDCASKCKGVSLNDMVYQGPDTTNKLLGVLLRFCQERVVLMADISAMFHQMRVTPPDYDALRFLWWPDGDMTKPAQEYRMAVHLFGGTWSPSCCNFVLQRTADDNRHFYHTETIDTIRRNFYVDDCLKSVPDEAIALKLYRELTDLLSKGGFVLTKWLSNSPKVLAEIPDEHRAQSAKGIDFNVEALPVERALGVYWDIEGDCFSYKFFVKDKPLTRRGVLSVVSSVYDPLGFACPFTIRAKMIIQDLCRMGLGWDTPLPIAETEAWMSWKQELPKLEFVKIPRCLKSVCAVESSYELHHFADASERSYGAVSYIRALGTNRDIHCKIVMAKAHLAPIKQQTIPRLELEAATIAVKLDKTIRQELDIPIERTLFWTDSTVVLQYIANQDKRFHTFVANRLSVIHNGSLPNQWCHVPSELNPAHDLSRGLSADELAGQSRWTHGPAFLWSTTDNWPKQHAVEELSDDPEVKAQKEAAVACATQEDSASAGQDVLDRLMLRYSSWYKLKRVTALLLRVKDYLLKRVKGTPVPRMLDAVSVTELRNAELAICRYVQKVSFPQDLQTLSTKGKNDLSTTLRRGSQLQRLDPKIFNDGIMRVGGRLKNAGMPENMRHPIILPKNHHVVELLVQDAHERSGHSGREHVLGLLRERFWVLGARYVIGKMLKRCRLCTYLHTQPSQQKMGDLSKDRVTPNHPPFTYVGVDYFGPFSVKRGRSIVKRYGCIFTCMAIRAVHIEISHSLETDSFLNALQRFISRRGQPEVIRSDNGTNFVGAQRELRELIRSWNQKTIGDYLLQKEIQWIFNPPHASHMGGVWERQIRTVRRLINSITKEQTMDDEGLSTLMCVIESIINGRPITVVSDDATDLEPLTPNHLLLLRSGTTFFDDTSEKIDLLCRKRWHQVQYMANVFWRRWLREYLPTLQQRNKWVKPFRNIEVGDIVLIVDESLPRNQWLIGRITETHKGQDNLVRSAKVKTKSNILVRPINKLCLLESVEKSEDNSQG